MNTNIVLVPNNWDLRQKTFSLDEKDWGTAVRAVEKRGCNLNAFGGFDRQSAKLFAQHVKGAVEQGKLCGDVFDDLVTFLTGNGAGGLVISRGFPRWNRA